MDQVQETAVQSDNTETVTDSANPVDAVTDTKSDNVTTPVVERREGKLFIDGTRVYTRDDVNKIGANARREVESLKISPL